MTTIALGQNRRVPEGVADEFLRRDAGRATDDLLRSLQVTIEKWTSAEVCPLDSPDKFKAQYAKILEVDLRDFIVSKDKPVRHVHLDWRLDHLANGFRLEAKIEFIK